jgi:hypothetical protein
MGTFPASSTTRQEDFQAQAQDRCAEHDCHQEAVCTVTHHGLFLYRVFL